MPHGLARFSSSYDSARTAAKEAKEALPETRIALLDTENAAGGEGLVVLEAWRVAERGAGLQDVVAAARAVASRVCLLAFLDTPLLRLEERSGPGTGVRGRVTPQGQATARAFPRGGPEPGTLKDRLTGHRAYAGADAATCRDATSPCDRDARGRRRSGRAPEAEGRSGVRM